VIYDQLYYRYPVARLGAGGSYGNPDCFIRTDAASNLDSVWLAASNQWVCGTLTCALHVGETRLAAEETELWPGHQVTTFAGAGVAARLTVFVPVGRPVGTGAQVYFGLEITSVPPIAVTVTWDIRWPPFLSRIHSKQPERAQWQKRVRQWQEDDCTWAATVPTHYTRYQSTVGDADEVRVFSGPGPAIWTASEPSRLRATYEVRIGSTTPWQGGWLLSVGQGGIAAVRQAHDTAPDWVTALAATRAALETELATTALITPDAVINRGLLWAKINTLRVQHQYRQGVGFTNDPPQDIVVVRDCAWYALGADWFSPGFTRAMYDLLLAHGREADGKLTEYIHADSGAREDYGLNVNDDTPLFVVAVHHHYAVTGDTAFLQAAYPAIQNACDSLLAQRQDGLVWCTVQGTDVWGNATWRNIIPGYHLAGAVTEINSLTVWALACAHELATVVGADADAARWAAARDQLRAAMEAQLRDPETGTYLLNRDAEGPHATLTADLVFPVLAGVAEGEEATAILDRLYSAEFYTPFGIHTVSRAEAEYDPAYGYGLLGGLWPNLTAWVAYAGRTRYPDRLVAMMQHLYALSEPADPRAGGNLVPGEFPEWFHGETYQSLGMAMSPWMPPTYLWLGLEGLMGLRPTPTGLHADPHLPADWSWIGLRNLPYRGDRISLFACDGRIYSTTSLESTWPVAVFAADATEALAVKGEFYTLALQGPAGGVVLVATPTGGQGRVGWGRAHRSVTLAAGAATVLAFSTEELG
jgi:hypothetical protein